MIHMGKSAEAVDTIWIMEADKAIKACGISSREYHKVLYLVITLIRVILRQNMVQLIVLCGGIRRNETFRLWVPNYFLGRF